jgi:hypothetical protein
MNTFTSQELADFYQKVADGGEIGFRHTTLGEFNPALVGPCLHSSTQDWRIKPTKKVIDLSVLIESGIDCEFSDDGIESRIGKLLSIKEDGTFISEDWVWSSCRPRMNHIHAWQGGDCPLPEGFEVKVWLRGGLVEERVSVAELQWSHPITDINSGIIYFEVLGLADGYVMPWEGE